MKYSILISILLLSIACSKQQESTQVAIETEPMKEITMVEVDTVSGKTNEYIVTEEVFWLLPQEQEKHFDNAKENYTRKAMTNAAVEIKKASVYLTMEIDKAEDSEKPKLIAVKDNLLSLSDRLEKGEKVNEIELREAFYQTNMALYRNYLSQQNKVLLAYSNDKNTVGLHLDAALQKIEYAEKWSDKKFDGSDRALINNGKSLVQKMKNGLKKDEKAIQEEWAKLLEILKHLDEKLEGSAID